MRDRLCMQGPASLTRWVPRLLLDDGTIYLTWTGPPPDRPRQMSHRSIRSEHPKACGATAVRQPRTTPPTAAAAAGQKTGPRRLRQVPNGTTGIEGPHGAAGDMSSTAGLPWVLRFVALTSPAPRRRSSTPFPRKTLIRQSAVAVSNLGPAGTAHPLDATHPAGRSAS